jgi:hypothetical protein
MLCKPSATRLDIAQQVHAVEKAISTANKTLIYPGLTGGA